MHAQSKHGGRQWGLPEAGSSKQTRWCSHLISDWRARCYGTIQLENWPLKRRPLTFTYSLLYSRNPVDSTTKPLSARPPEKKAKSCAERLPICSTGSLLGLPFKQRLFRAVASTRNNNKLHCWKKKGGYRRVEKRESRSGLTSLPRVGV